MVCMAVVVWMETPVNSHPRPDWLQLDALNNKIFFRAPAAAGPARASQAGAHALETRLQALFVQGVEGNADAYRALLKALAAHLRAFLRRRLQRWPDEVEDLVQECLLAIHNQRLTYESGVPFTAWVHAIARYKLIDWLRRHARHDALHDPLDDAAELLAGADGDDATTGGEARRDLGVLLDALPDKQRAAIVLTKLDGLSVREAAGRLAMSESAVKVTVHRGLKALADKMRKQP
jgi:RNA polymerase sigma-70 factor (ECF subfamily)